MKRSDQLLLEQAYDDVNLRCVPSKLTTVEILDKYNLVTISSTDISMLVKALDETKFDKKGVKIISRVLHPQHVYLIIPRGIVLGPTDHIISKINYLKRRIHDVIQPQKLKTFLFAGEGAYIAPANTEWNEITDKFHDLRKKLPELEGIF